MSTRSRVQDINFGALCALEKAAEKDYERVAASTITGDSLQDDLVKAMAAVTREIDRNVQCYSSLAWLCYLRLKRIRRLITWLNDGMETAHHLEAFTAKSRQDQWGVTIRKDQIVPNFDSHKLRKSAQLVGGAFIYRQLNVFKSMLALEVGFRLGPKRYPEPAISDEQKQNLEAYNNRARGQPMLLSTGAGIAATTGEHDSEATTFVCVGFDEEKLNFPVGPLGLSKLREICRLNIVSENRMQEIGDVLLALKVGYILCRNSGRMAEIHSHGFICILSRVLIKCFESAESIVGAIRQLLPQWQYSSPTSTIENLKSAGIDVGYAPAIRAAGEILALDLHSGSLLLDLWLFKSFVKRDSGRGPAFEDEVQHLIDQTEWKPTDEIRNWRGRTIKIDHQVITDIDAVGENNGTLLIIEAKALYYSSGYGAADRGEVRNVREKCEAAVRCCPVTKLSAATNIDLTKFSRIVRIVCTPHPVYCAAEYTVPDDSGFPATMSYWELNRKLGPTTLFELKPKN